MKVADPDELKGLLEGAEQQAHAMANQAVNSAFDQAFVFVEMPDPTPWPFRRSAMLTTNLNCLMTAALVATATFFMAMTSATKDFHWLLFILVADAGLTMASLFICLAWPQYHDIQEGQRFRVCCLEILSIAAKLGLTWFFVDIIEPRPADWSVLGIEAVYLLLVALQCFRRHCRTFDSLVDDKTTIAHGLLLVLLANKVARKLEISWRLVFIIQTITGYLLFACMSLACLVFICFTTAAAISGIFTVSILGLCIFLAAKLVEGLFLIGVSQLADPSVGGWVGNIQTLIIVYGSLYVTSQLLVVFGGSLVSIKKLLEATKSRVDLRSLPFVGRVLDKIPPDYYVAVASTINGAASLGKSPDEDEKPECVLCCENKANCLVLDCKHGGVCENCAERQVSKTKRCPVCGLRCQSVGVIEKEGDHKYKVNKKIELKAD